MNFTEKQQSCIVVEKLTSQREAGQFCDVTLVVQGEKFKAHRNVLAACSEYFSSLFITNRIKKEKVTIGHCKNVAAFRSLLNYMYTGVIVLDCGNVSELLRFARKFRMTNVKVFCEMYLREHITASNCLSFRDLAVKYELHSIQDNVIEFIRNNIKEILDQNQVLQLNAKKIEHFWKEFDISRQDLFRFLCKWVCVDSDGRASHFKDLLRNIDWHTVNLAFVEDNSDSYSLVEKHPKCMYYFLSVLKENGINLQEYKTQFASLELQFGNVNGKIDTCDANLDVINLETFVETAYNETNGTEVGILPRRSKSKKSTSQLEEYIIPDDYCEDKNSVSSESGSDTEKNVRKTKRKKKAKWKDGVQCDKCSYIAYNSNRLEQHRSSVHKKDVTYRCKICEFTCKWSREYFNHMKNHYKGPPFNCIECEYSSTKLHLLLSHIVKHTDERPFMCEECGYRSRSKQHLEQHVRTHTGEKPFACEQCGHRFTCKTRLDVHMSSHRQDRPFLCDICGFSTKYRGKLVVHMRIHTGKVFRCDFPKCTYSAPCRTQVSLHKASHSGIRSHICLYCGTGFTHKNGLMRHERIHLNENPFKCENCDYSSCRKDKLKEHVLKHHSNSSTNKNPFRPRKQRLVRVNEENKQIASTDLDNCQQINTDLQMTTGNNQQGESNNNSNSENQSCASYNPPQVCFNYENYQARNYPFPFNQSVNLPHVGPSPPSAVPAISSEIPTQFRSFMSFM